MEFVESTIFKTVAQNLQESLADPALKNYVIEKPLDGGGTARIFNHADFNYTRATLRALLSGKLKEQEKFPACRSLKVREALMTGDISMAIPKAITDIMVEPEEPTLVAQNFLTKTLPVTGWSFTLTSLGAIRAHEVAEGQEYQIEYLHAARASGDVRVRKFGLRVGISEQYIADSEWDLIGLHVRAAGLALKRIKEEKYWDFLQEHAWVVIDNDSAAAPDSSGVGNDHTTANLSMAIDDFVKLFATLIRNGYNCTDVVAHPYFWEVMALDPELRWIWMQGGNAAPPLGEAASAAFPFSFRMHLTPYANGAIGDYDPPRIDIYAIDATDPVLYLQRDQPSTEEWTDPTRDIVNVKLRERWGIGIGNEGKSLAVAKGIRVTKNFGESIYSRGATGPTT